MKRSGLFLTRILVTLFVALLLSVSSGLSAQGSSVIPSVAPGVYSAPQLLSFAVPAGCRLLVSVDGNPSFEPSVPVLLSVAPGFEKDFLVDAELHSLLPGTSMVEKFRFVWRIDMKSPAAPTFSARPVDGGHSITFNLPESGKIDYQMYHPLYHAYNSDSVASGDTVFLPSGAVLCATGIDEAGNRGGPISLGPYFADPDAIPFKILNPLPGNWADSQVLLIESAPGTDVFYSVDGSDPSVTGIDYGGPVLIDTAGKTRLRVAAVSSSGRQFSAEVFYTVEKAVDKKVAGLPSDGSLIDLKEFGELTVPEGYFWSIGDSSPSIPGGKAIVFSSVRGMVCHYPLTVTDGTKYWRWVCASGVRPPLEKIEDVTKEEGKPEIRILDWYFVSVNSRTPVYFSRDGKSWSLYTDPVFFDRIADSAFWWYSSGWKSGEVQKVSLPARPTLTGVSDDAITGNPVFLGTTASPFVYHYEISSSFRAPLPSVSSPSLASGLLFEVPLGVSSPFSVRVVAMYDGLVHGELETSFLLDRKVPRAPSAGIDPKVTWSRIPVRMTPSGEDMLQVSVMPGIFSRDGKSWILEGDPARPVDYTVTLFAVDRAGNKSPVVTRNITVDLNAIYVDAARGSGSRDGTPSAPYASLDDAFDAVRGPERWRIYVSGETTLKRIHTLRTDVSIVCEAGTRILAERDAGISVQGGNFSLSNCSILRNEKVPAAASVDTEPLSLPGRLHAFFDVSFAKFSLDAVDLESSGANAGSLVRASDSTVVCKKSSFSLDAPEYALLFDLLRSTAVVDSSSFSVASRNASALSLTSSSIRISDSSIAVTPVMAGRAIESWDSTLTVSGLAIERQGSVSANRDTAIWLDRKSRLSKPTGITVKGFARETGGDTK